MDATVVFELEMKGHLLRKELFFFVYRVWFS